MDWAGIPKSLSSKLYTSSYVKPITNLSIGGCTLHPKPIPPTPPNGFVTPVTFRPDITDLNNIIKK